MKLHESVSVSVSPKYFETCNWLSWMGERLPCYKNSYPFMLISVRKQR